MRAGACLVLWLSALSPLSVAEEARMTPVPTLDLQRYAGTCRLDVVNECVEKDGRTSRASGVYAGILERAARFYDVSRVVRTEQRPPGTPRG